MRNAVALSVALWCMGIHREASAFSNATEDTLRAKVEEQAKLYIAPELPAFTFLGANPTTVNRPTTPKGIAVALASGVDSAGRALQGCAFEFQPTFLPSVFRTDLGSYQQSGWVRALANARLSIGSSRVSGDSASTDVAIGFSTLLVDLGDPMRDKTFAKELEAVLTGDWPGTPLPAGQPVITNELRAKVKKQRDSWVDEHWNARRTMLAAATGLRLEKSKFDDSRGIGASGWLVHSEGLGKRSQLLLHLQYDHRRSLAGSEHRQDLTYGGRVNIGAPSLNGFLELAGTSDLEHDNDPKGKWSGGIEFMLGESLWASTGLGSGLGPGDASDRVVILANIRWAIADGARLTSH